MNEQVAHRLEVLRVRLKVETCSEVAELMRRHVDADLLRDRLGYLLRQRLLALAPAALRHEAIAVGFATKTRQNLAPVPADRLSQLRQELEGQVPPLCL